MFKRTLINNQIRAPQVRLIDETGKQLGVVSLEEALRIAHERSLDLIQITEKVEPPVCKIEDYGKYLYREEKKARLAKKQRISEIKGLRLTFNISPHDLQTRVNQTEKFLKRGDRVRIELRLFGREKAFSDLAREKVNKFLEMLRSVIPIKTERDLKREPRGFTMIISKE